MTQLSFTSFQIINIKILKNTISIFARTIHKMSLAFENVSALKNYSFFSVFYNHRGDKTLNVCDSHFLDLLPSQKSDCIISS